MCGTLDGCFLLAEGCGFVVCYGAISLCDVGQAQRWLCCCVVELVVLPTVVEGPVLRSVGERFSFVVTQSIAVAQPYDLSLLPAVSVPQLDTPGTTSRHGMNQHFISDGL